MAKKTTHRNDIGCDGNGKFTHSDAHMKAARNHQLQWSCADGPFTIKFAGMSPSNKLQLHGKAGATVAMNVHAAARPGVYKYIVAVSRSEGIFINDPDVEIEY